MKRKQKNLLIILVCLLAVAVYLFMRTTEGFQSTDGKFYFVYSADTYVYTTNTIARSLPDNRQTYNTWYINMLTNKEEWNNTLTTQFTLIAGIPYLSLKFPVKYKEIKPTFPTSMDRSTFHNVKYFKLDSKNSLKSVYSDLNLMSIDGILIKPKTNIIFDATFQSQMWLAYFGPSTYFYMDVVNSNNPTQALNVFQTQLSNGGEPRAPQRAPGATLTPILTTNNTYIVLMSATIYKTATFPVNPTYTLLYPVTKNLSGQFVDAITYVPETYTFTPLSEASATALENAYNRHKHIFTSLFPTEDNVTDAIAAPIPAPTHDGTSTATATAAAETPAAAPAASAAVASNSPQKKDNTLLYVSLGLGIPLVLGLVTILSGR